MIVHLHQGFHFFNQYLDGQLSSFNEYTKYRFLCKANKQGKLFTAMYILTFDHVVTYHYVPYITILSPYIYRRESITMSMPITYTYYRQLIFNW